MYMAWTRRIKSAEPHARNFDFPEAIITFCIQCLLAQASEGYRIACNAGRKIRGLKEPLCASRDSRVGMQRMHAAAEWTMPDSFLVEKHNSKHVATRLQEESGKMTTLLKHHGRIMGA